MVDSGGETPGPIPNPEAKPARADGTAPGRRWESRLPPTQQLHTNTRHTPTQVRGGCFRIPATPTAREHHNSASRTLQAPTHSATRTPRRAGQLSPVADNTGTSMRTPRPRIADTVGTYTLHNAGISTGGKACDRFVADFATALRTPQAPTHSTMQTSRRARRPSPVADTATPHCRHCRYLRTPQCKHLYRWESM